MLKNGYLQNLELKLNTQLFVDNKSNNTKLNDPRGYLLEPTFSPYLCLSCFHELLKAGVFLHLYLVIWNWKKIPNWLIYWSEQKWKKKSCKSGYLCKNKIILQRLKERKEMLFFSHREAVSYLQGYIKSDFKYYLLY